MFCIFGGSVVRRRYGEEKTRFKERGAVAEKADVCSREGEGGRRKSEKEREKKEDMELFAIPGPSEKKKSKGAEKREVQRSRLQ